MKRINIIDLAEPLATRHKLTREEAQDFLEQVFAVIRDGMGQDGQVKVRGLGTFKSTSVEARESVNVNTGERIVIDSHAKLAFLPDPAMREVVNRPFSLFDTVILNDGVVFNDTENEGGEDNAAPGDVEESLAPVQEVEEKPVQDEPAEEKDEVQNVSEAEADNAAVEESEAVVEVEDETVADEEEDSEEATGGRSRLWWAVGAVIAVLVVLAFAYKDTIANAFSPQEPVALKTDSIPPAKKDTAVIKSSATEEMQKDTIPSKTATVKKDTLPDYDAMDNRIRTGAYRIVGMDYSVKARDGETMEHLTKRTLGPGMECYIETFNGIRGPLSGGQAVKIPKLELRKKSRQNKNIDNN